ncbi:MAG: DUF3365 domain-containing protein [Thermodesulfovibrionales bacterium]|nr:DUF3365 domain-containing protein [Thermodesulfovibrionales bacterium]
MKLKNLKLSTKFTFTVGLILLTFCIIFSFLLYVHLKDRVIEDANEKTLIIMTQVGAVGDYIKNTLRPRMFEFLKSTDANDAFIVEAMSTTHVTQEVMKRFNANLKDYIYRRVSDNPLNPNNKADQLHEELISRFRKEREQNSWNGIIKINNEDYIIRAKAIAADKKCLTCLLQSVQRS